MRIFNQLAAAALLLGSYIYGSLARVTISGRRLQVHGKDFFVKGIDYTPVPIGQYPGQSDIYNNSALIDRDLPLMAAMGVNTIRIYAVSNPTSFETYQYFLDSCLKHNIMVIFSYWVDIYANFSDPAVCDGTVNGFVSMVKTFSEHPAILYWMYGNELNLYASDYAAMYRCINQARLAAHDAEDALHRYHMHHHHHWHPVSSPVADVNLIDNVAIYDYAVDLWSLQIYRGNSFYTLFSVYAQNSSKPMLITEFGAAEIVPGPNGVNNTLNATLQAEVVEKLTREMIANKEICSGGHLFEYMDEWWKGGDANNQLPNEAAYYGIVSVSRYANRVGPDVVTPKPAFWSYLKVMQSVGDVYSNDDEDDSTRAVAEI